MCGAPWMLGRSWSAPRASGIGPVDDECACRIARGCSVHTAFQTLSSTCGGAASTPLEGVGATCGGHEGRRATSAARELCAVKIYGIEELRGHAESRP